MESNFTNLAGGDGVSIHTGFPNPAADRQDQSARLTLDINALLVKHPSSTYLFRIAGHSWTEHGIFDGDIAIVDRALPPRQSDLVISWENDAFTIQRQSRHADTQQIWGVITAIIHQYDRSS